ncbi:MAG: DUF5335 family protein [Thermoanaerobaculia bacterium]|nr:DUF5335 family protein [Thermoanaerobaculia bacterium]
METRVDQSKWDELAKKLCERYEGTEVAVTILDPEMGEHHEIDPEPLIEIATEHVEGIDRFDLTMGTLDHPFTHAVPWTRDVWLDSAEDGSEEIVPIVGENGITTVVRCCREVR